MSFCVVGLEKTFILILYAYCVSLLSKLHITVILLAFEVKFNFDELGYVGIFAW